MNPPSEPLAALFITKKKTAFTIVPVVVSRFLTAKTNMTLVPGWPSYTRPIAPESIGTREDKQFFAVRTEVHCSRCGGHLGHVFDDGPAPTGLRYCMNGVALTFKGRGEAPPRLLK